MRSIGRLLLMIGAVVALSAFVFVACGDDDEDADATNTPAAAATATTGDGGEATEPSGEATEPSGEATTPAGGAEGDAAAGEEIFQADCVACHTTDGSELVGPTWQGLWGHEVELEDGTTVTVDEEYVTESIRDPSAKVVAGFSPVMPPFDLSDEEIANVIAFMQTLQ